MLGCVIEQLKELDPATVHCDPAVRVQSCCTVLKAHASEFMAFLYHITGSPSDALCEGHAPRSVWSEPRTGRRRRPWLCGAPVLRLLRLAGALPRLHLRLGW